jgi:hypothetical protein
MIWVYGGLYLPGLFGGDGPEWPAEFAGEV